jgi:hypothetical protein
MTLRVKLEIAAVVTALVLCVVGGRMWLEEHDARLRAEESSKAQQAVQADARAEIAAIQKQMADRDAAYQAQLQTLNTKFSQAASPDQIAQLVTQLMGLKQPIQILTPAPTAQNPNPQPVAQVPLVDAPQAKAYLQDCEECKAARVKLQADVADREQQMAAAQKQIDSLKTERDTWEKTAKGGTKLQRIGRAMKWIGVGVVVGLAASQVKH